MSQYERVLCILNLIRQWGNTTAFQENQELWHQLMSLLRKYDEDKYMYWIYNFHTGWPMESKPPQLWNFVRCYKNMKLFIVQKYKLLIDLELKLPGSHLNFILRESDKTHVLLFFKKWRIQMNHCMPTHLQPHKGCSGCKDLLKGHCLQTAGLWKKSPLLLQVLAFSVRCRHQKALRPTLQDKRHINSRI